MSHNWTLTLIYDIVVTIIWGAPVFLHSMYAFSYIITTHCASVGLWRQCNIIPYLPRKLQLFLGSHPQNTITLLSTRCLLLITYILMFSDIDFFVYVFGDEFAGICWVFGPEDHHRVRESKDSEREGKEPNEIRVSPVKPLELHWLTSVNWSLLADQCSSVCQSAWLCCQRQSVYSLTCSVHFSVSVWSSL